MFVVCQKISTSYANGDIGWPGCKLLPSAALAFQDVLDLVPYSLNGIRYTANGGYLKECSQPYRTAFARYTPLRSLR